MSDTLLYDVHGNAYRQVRDLGDGELLAYTQVEWHGYDDEGSGLEDGSLVVLQSNSVSGKPPTRKLNEAIEKLKTEKTNLQNELRALRSSIKTAVDEHDAAWQQFKTVDKLKRLRDFIAGKITHYVQLNWDGPLIVEFNDARCECDKKDLKLLTLFGSANGELQWNVNRYRDDSGSWDTVIPCCSHDEAMQVVAKYFDDEEATAFDENTRCTPRRTQIERAAKYGITMSDKYVAAVEAAEAKEKAEKIAKLKRTLAELTGDDCDNTEG